MSIEFYYDPEGVLESPENEGMHDGIERTIRRIKEAGVEYRLVNAAGLSREQREDAYGRLAVPPSVRKRYRVRRLFGSHKHSGGNFGRGVPALVVLEQGRPQDVYPHEEQDGTIVTVSDYLDSLERRGDGEDNGDRERVLATRMDSLRARIGVVNATARELIEEGRRR